MVASRREMAFRLSAEMMEEIAVSALSKGRCILLVKTPEQAEKIALKVRLGIEKELRENPDNYVPQRVRGTLAVPSRPSLKPVGANPTFVQLTHGGWVFVWPADDMHPDEELGQPQVVYWPSEGGTYEKVTYELWKQSRLKGDIYRPMSVTAPKKKGTGRPTAWERLLSDEDD
jgi:hypothetical protein